ncbi:adenosine deaminase 2 [Drosophila willistoni]|nr:adenosine deaminase 2 [Drosophila willistoni]
MATTSNKCPFGERIIRLNLTATSNTSMARHDQSHNDNDAERARGEINNKTCSHCFLHFGIVSLFCLLLALVWLIFMSLDFYDCTPEERFARRHLAYVSREERQRLGGRVRLSPLEEKANFHLMNDLKMDNQSQQIWRNYEPHSHLLNIYNISETKLYSLLRTMPKGGLLHVHDSGMLNTKLLVELIERDDLWTCVGMDNSFEDFRFSLKFPSQIGPQSDYKCTWMLMSQLKQRDNQTVIEEQLKSSLSMNVHSFTNSTHLARHLRRAHRLVYGLITFRPVWRNFLFNMLEDFYADGVSYVELRSSLPVLYDLEGNNYSLFDTAHSLATAAKIFKSTYPNFIDLKLIYAPLRESNDNRLDEYIENVRMLKKQFPNLITGFDLLSLGNECDLPQLSQLRQLLHISKEIDFYFHAGESRCMDMAKTNENLLDALLMGSKRIGNALNLPLHPEILKTMRQSNVAIEINPLSNYYLQYVNDFRQHPAAYLIAAGFPIVVGSDYPYFWNASPLTSDFYVTFVGIASGQDNLRLLKQLAMNSFIYSSLNGEEKMTAMAKWQCHWDNWLKRFVSQ